MAPKFDPRPNVPRNLSRALRGAHDPEKISEIALTVAGKIEFEKKLAPPGGQTGSVRGHVTIYAESYPKVLESLRI